MGLRERRAVYLLLGLAVLGHAVRAFGFGSARPSLENNPISFSGVSPDAQRVASVQAGRPLGPGERLNPDLVSAKALTRLPGVGPTLAERIISDRDQRGPFRDLDGLMRVSGIGPATARKLKPYLRFSGFSVPRGPLDLNRATPEELQMLPGIGPSRAQAIVAYRKRHGPFPTLGALSRVPGLGRKSIERLDGLAIVQ